MIAPSLVTSADELPEYPIPTGERLPGQYFLKWETLTYLNSAFYLRADREVRCLYIEAICISQHQSPIGTLPVDQLELARLLRTPLDDWRALSSRDPGPLYKWEQCITDRGEVRLMHHKVLEVLMDQMARRGAVERAKGEAAVRKRIERLRFRMQESRRFSPAEIASDTLCERMDAWLAGNVAGNRRAQHYDAVFDKAQREGWAGELKLRR